MSAQRRMRWGLVLIVVVIAAGGAAMMWAPLLDWARLIHDLVLSWGAWGVLGYILLFALWNLFLPPSPLQALAGFIYGVTGGLLITYAGATLALIGAVVAMRALSREGLEAMLQRRPMLRAIDRAVAASGWKAVILLRLCNLVPSTVANLALGCSSLRMWTILWASWVGKFPGLLLMACIGAASKHLLDGQVELGVWTWVMMAVTIAATLAIIVVVGRSARQYWAEGGLAPQPESAQA